MNVDVSLSLRYVRVGPIRFFIVQKYPHHKK